MDKHINKLNFFIKVQRAIFSANLERDVYSVLLAMEFVIGIYSDI